MKIELHKSYVNNTKFSEYFNSEKKKSSVSMNYFLQQLREVIALKFEK